MKNINNLMKSTILFKIFGFIITIFLIFYINLITSDNCKKFTIFKSFVDLGPSHLEPCFSNKNLLPKIKKILSKTPILYEIGRKYRRTFITDDFILDNPPTQENLKHIETQEKFHNSQKKPFIKGLVNTDFIQTDYSIKNENNNNWGRSHGDHKNSKYHPGKNINRGNIKNLELIWKYEAIKKNELETKYIQNIESNPIFIDNKIISITADWKVIANNALTGDLEWQIQSIHAPGRRGIISYEDIEKNKSFIFVPLGGKIYKINTNNGKLEKKFGQNGSVKSFTLVAPLIYKDNLIIINTNSISIFNIFDGKKIGSYGLTDYKRNFLKGIIWGGAALDQENGIIFVNTGNPQPGVYGVHRPGSNRNSSSVIAFDLTKKKVLWTFQETSHDLWDFDIASPPIIHNLKIKDKLFEVVISTTKRGNTLILERKTGQPIFDITYRKAPRSNITGDYSAPYQIFLEKPEKFSNVEFGFESFNKLPENKINEINHKIKNSKYGWLETPSFDNDLIIFGLHGGSQWMGSSIDPKKQYLYIPVNNVPWKIKPYIQSREIKTFFSGRFKKAHHIYIKKCSSCHGKNRNGIRQKYKEKEEVNIPSLVGFYSNFNLENKLSSLGKIKSYHDNLDLNKEELEKLNELFKEWDNKLLEKNEMKVEGNGNAWSQFLTSDDLPASNPPWGYIAKLNLENGKIEWKAAHGDKKINGKVIKTGSVNFGGTALNGSDILFFTGTDDAKAYAIDANTGKELWSFKMDSAGSAPPTIFEINGKQYVTFIATGGIYHNYKDKSSSVYTFGIKN